MRVPVLICAALLASAPLHVSAQAVGERPLSASRTYQTCKAAAVSMADERRCLVEELAWAEAALRMIVQDAGIDEQSQALWRASVTHDCAGEEALAGGGNSGPDRRAACMIEQTYDRADYLQRRGRW